MATKIYIVKKNRVLKMVFYLCFVSPLFCLSAYLFLFLYSFAVFFVFLSVAVLSLFYGLFVLVYLQLKD